MKDYGERCRRYLPKSRHFVCVCPTPAIFLGEDVNVGLLYGSGTRMSDY